jgi:hypothetical protein
MLSSAVVESPREQLQRVVDRRERVAKLVREHREEAIALLDLVAQGQLDPFQARDVDERQDHTGPASAAEVGEHPHQIGESLVVDPAFESLPARAYAVE